MKVQLITLAGIALLAAGCGGSTTNTNNSRANVTNLGANNANTGAVVVNSNANTAANRWNPNITREEYERNKSDYEKEKGSSTIGQGANDMWLWVKTRASLLGTSDLRESTINVDVVNDVVTLKGTVATAAQKAKAEQVAKDIDGVKSVKNELKVAPSDSMTNMSSNNSNTNKR
jgi:osmotically-inducible protein OsmY